MSDETPLEPSAPRPPEPPARRTLRRGAALTAALGGVVAIGLGVATVDARTVAAASGAPAAIALSLAMVLAAWLAEGAVFAAIPGGSVSPRRLLRMTGVYLGGSFPSAVTPFASGAIPTWTWLLTREGLSPGEAAAVVALRSAVTSAFFGLGALAAAAALPGILGPSWGRVALGLAATLAVVVGSLAAVALRPDAALAALRRMAAFPPLARIAGAARLERLEERLTSEVASFASLVREAVRRRPLGLAAALAATLVSRALLFSVPYVLLRGFGVPARWLPLVLGMLAVQAVGSATPAPGGSGFSEVALAGLLRAAAPSYVLGATVVLWRLLTFWLEMAAGALVFSRAAASTRRA